MTTEIDWTPKARAILDAASDLFYAQGIHAVGVEAIAERAGVTKRTLYDRFGSKERLVVEYLLARDASWRAFLADRLAAADNGVVAQVSAVFDASRGWAAERGPKGCSMINAHAEISDPAHPAYPVIVGQKRWMLELFTRIVDTAGTRVSEAIAARLMLLHEGALVAAGMGVVEDAFDEARSLAVELLRSERVA
ncbi:TetR/AcrR family transcriptional regulator [Gordonia sp. SL306]|uniref:TetR/AcrR family transcriptional regulator n=1 Tax=Gordonia sp. SL306 TaxID=2995145 RepID=UPI002270DA60|nr:TetR/AcrR family transcriptional regulator [Gordonia sp. SL306]WAC53736.1 helix-turn-helix domain containing protein [Gordonia sp. SL306]